MKKTWIIALLVCANGFAHEEEIAEEQDVEEVVDSAEEDEEWPEGYFMADPNERGKVRTEFKFFWGKASQ